MLTWWHDLIFDTPENGYHQFFNPFLFRESRSSSKVCFFTMNSNLYFRCGDLMGTLWRGTGPVPKLRNWKRVAFCKKSLGIHDVCQNFLLVFWGVSFRNPPIRWIWHVHVWGPNKKSNELKVTSMRNLELSLVKKTSPSWIWCWNAGASA